MNPNVKVDATTSAPPRWGWAPRNTRDRLLSQLDAATGSLTGDQQRWFADLPSEQFSSQPSTSNKMIASPDGSVEYRQLAPYGGAWRDAHMGGITTTGAMRP